MNIFTTLALIIIAGAAQLANCCSTKNDYHYNVVDCKTPQIHALGDYILDKIKKKKDIRPNTCYESGVNFLQKAPFESTDKDFDSRRISAVWVYKHANEKGTVFAGVEETLAALNNKNTYNIIVDKKFSVHRYILRNSTDGSIKIVYLSDDELMLKVSSEKYWEKQDVVQCENFLFYLSKQYPNQLLSFTVADKYKSNDELRFIMLSGGLGGFYKADNDNTELSNDQSEDEDVGEHEQVPKEE